MAFLALILWLGPRSIAILKESKEFEEIGAGPTWKTTCTDAGLFWVGFYFSRGFAAQSCSRQNRHATQTSQQATYPIS